MRVNNNDEAVPRLQGARGIHLMFKKGALSNDYSIIVTKVKDGRLILIIKYIGLLVFCANGEKCEATHYAELS